MNHLNSKSVIGLGAATLVAVVAAVAISVGKQPASETGEAAKPALPGLKGHLNEIRTVSLVGAGNKPVATLEKGEKGWTLKEKANYPADAGKLREFLLKLADANLIERKTTSEKLFGELGVQDAEAADAKGVQVTLGGIEPAPALIIGSFSAKGGGTYVRRPGEMQSWLAKGSLAADKVAANWLDKALADIPATRLREVVLTRVGGKPLRAWKDQPGDANYKVADLPKGRELSSEFAPNGLAATLAGLRFDDVFPAAEVTPPAEDKQIKAHYVTFDGLAVDVHAWKQDDKSYALFTASLDPALAEAHVQAEQAKARADWEAKQAQQKAEAAKPAEGEAAQKGDKAEARPAEPAPLAISDPARDRQDRLDALNRELDTLRHRFDGWAYVLPAYKYANIDKPVEDLLKPLDAKKDDKPAAKPVPGKPVTR